MIICKLSTILGAKRIKVSDVCRGTGIARATLDRYYYDRVKSFDRDVLGRLCQFLQVGPGELLVEIDQGDLFAEPPPPQSSEEKTA
jgi:putative transcriptional regulator